MECKNCGSSNLEIIKSGPHNELICKDCNSFQKFLNAKDKETFDNLNIETEETIEIKGDEKIFNRFKRLSFLVRSCSGIIQNDMKITLEDRQNFINQIDEIYNEITYLKKSVLNNIDTKKNKYDNFVNDLLKNTNALNEEVPWD